MALGPGSIAFVGYNADATDNLAFVALEHIAAGTVIWFTDNEWDGNAFNTGEATWSWTATGDVGAGAIVTLDGLGAGNTASSNLGTIAFTSPSTRDLSAAAESVYAYVGDANAPSAFLTALTTAAIGFTNAAIIGVLTNTGLTVGATALHLGLIGGNLDIGAYNGPRSGLPSLADYAAALNTATNWIKEDTQGNDSNNGNAPDVPFSTTGFTADPNAQVLRFQSSSLSIAKAEGNGGTVTYTFVVERAGTTVGAISFSGTFGGTADAADFGGSLPTFSGVIADGDTTATVTITVTGDTAFEPDETFTLTLTGGTNGVPGINVSLSGATTATGTIANDDPAIVVNGQVYTQDYTITGASQFVVQQGGTMNGTLNINGANGTALINDGAMHKAAFGQAINLTAGSGDTTVTLWNNATGVIDASSNGTGSSGLVYVSGSGNAKIVFNNAGRIEAPGTERVINANDFNGQSFILNNLAGGVITGTSETLRGNIDVNNAGTIVGDEALDYRSFNVVFNNLAGGLVQGAHHAVTGEAGATITNAAGGTMVGLNGSAVNVDNNATVGNTVFVTNHGLMQGKSANTEDSDGDAVDVDGRVNVENWGTIEGLGHNGYHSGEPNVSEGIAAGAAVIVNHEGGKIYGYGRAIQIDNSGNEAAFAPTTITNDGLIQGDGHGPTGVTPAEIALFAERIKGAEAINIIGTWADSLTNTATGQIIGGVKMGGGDDVVTNHGTMTATGGSAIDMGDGNDTLGLDVGSVVTGAILLGAGNDTAYILGNAVSVDGGTGDDTYYVANANAVLTEAAGGGFDKVLAGVDYTLAAGSEIEWLQANAGATGLTLTGNELANSLVGGEGGDTLNGGGGNDLFNGLGGEDHLNGGTGDDTYYVAAGDVVTEAVGEGFDTVFATSDFTLTEGSEVEWLEASVRVSPSPATRRTMRWSAAPAPTRSTAAAATTPSTGSAAPTFCPAAPATTPTMSRATTP